MSDYVSMNHEELKQELAQLQENYRAFQEQNLQLDLSRGKPGDVYKRQILDKPRFKLF